MTPIGRALICTSSRARRCARQRGGLADLRRIVARAPARLAAAGWLLLEHGFEQGSAVRELLQGAGFGALSTRTDGGGRERVSGGSRHVEDDQLLRFSRQIMLPQFDVAGQQRLLDARVLVVGLGGLGCPVAAVPGGGRAWGNWCWLTRTGWN